MRSARTARRPHRRRRADRCGLRQQHHDDRALGDATAARRAQARPRRRRRGVGRPTPIAATTTGSPATSRSAGTAASAAATRPEQVEVEQKVAEDFNASHPNIHLTFEAVPYAGARDTLATQIASGNGPDIVGPVGIGGAEAFHGQWLDLQPLIDKTGYDMSQFPEARSTSTTSAARARSASRSRSTRRSCSTEDLFEEAGSNEPPHEWGGKYTMPDGSEVDWDYDTAQQGRQAADRRQERQGRHAGRLRPRDIVQWGFEPQRDDLRQTGAYLEGRRRCVGDDGKTAQIPDAWAAAWKWFYDGIWTDHFAMTGPQFESTDAQPGRLPVLHRQRRDEPELPLVDLRRRRLRRRLEHGGDRRRTRARPRPPSTPTRSASTRPPSTPTRRSRS